MPVVLSCPDKLRMTGSGAMRAPRLRHAWQQLCVLHSHTCCRKMLGVWKDTSIAWLQGLVAALQQRHEERGGSPGSAPVVLWD